MAQFEETYEDVLQNIEFAIVSVYREQAELADHDVESALNALIVAYQAEQRGRTASPVQFAPLRHELYARLESVCAWRLGREALLGGTFGETGPRPTPISIAEVAACLKRIRKSVQTWTKRGGRQGYLKFVNEFII